MLIMHICSSCIQLGKNMQDLATSLLAHKGIRAGISGFKLASGASRVQKRNDDLEPREHDLASLVIMS